MIRKLPVLAIAAVLSVPLFAAASTGAIYGNAYDEGPDGYVGPVGNLCVEAYTIPTPGSAPALAGSDMTDWDGFYRIEGLDPGPYKVLFRECTQDWGMIFGRNMYESQWYQAKKTFDQADPVLVVTETIVNVTMKRFGRVGGHITDSNGAPAPNVCVTLNPGDPSVLFDQTDADGHYAIYSVPSGSYKVSLEDCVTREVFGWHAGGSNESDATPIEVFNNAETTVDSSLNITAITGVVTESNGAGIGGICVDATDGGGKVISSTRTWGTTYLVALPAAGNYRLHFEDCDRRGFRGEWYDDSPTRQHSTMLHVRQPGFVNGINAVLDPL